MDLVHEVGRVAKTHQWTSRIHVILPSVKLFVVFEGKVKSFVLGLEEETIRLKINTFDIGDVLERDNALLW